MTTPETKIITNSQNSRLVISNYGATITELTIIDKHKKPVNVVVSLDSPDAYTKDSYITHDLYLGCSVGRYAGRISNKKENSFLKDCKLTFKEGVHLHGGTHGFDKKYWAFEPQLSSNTVQLSYMSKHMEEGYPGNLNITVTYTLTEANEVVIEYTATTDKDTYVNLTNHAYYNLNGQHSILDHELQIASNHYLEVNAELIPTGKILPTLNSKYDRLSTSVIGRSDFDGYDDTFILNDVTKNVTLYAPATGIKMDVVTNQPAMVVYTPKVFPKINFKDNAVYTKYPAICFETQQYPDAPNNAQFPSTLLTPGMIYKNKSCFAFSVLTEN